MTFPAAQERKRYPSECSLCRGRIVERRVTLPYVDREGKVRVIEGAPAGVCDQCHETYLTVETSAAIDELLAGPPSKTESVSVWEFGEAE